MKKLMFSIAALAALALTGCGGVNNVESCNNWKNKVSCVGATVDCSVYANTTCDISAYFDCLSTAYTCNGNTLSTDATKLSACASKATCK